jgi:hypothetical protein
MPLAQQLARAMAAEICLLRVVEVKGGLSPLWFVTMGNREAG